MRFPKVGAWRSERYLDFVRSRPCLICGRPETVAHHESLWRGTMGGKAPDSHCVPLCVFCHSRRHAGGISRFYGNISVELTIIDQLTEYLAGLG